MNLTYKEAISKADSLKALGVREVYLERDKELPWHLATRCEPGGSHRMEIDTNVWFYGVDKQTGLEFRWSFDIEPYSANGKGHYEINAAGCRDVLSKLNGKAHTQFTKYLVECADKVKAKADEWRKLVERQDKDAAILLGITS